MSNMTAGTRTQPGTQDLALKLLPLSKGTQGKNKVVATAPLHFQQQRVAEPGMRNGGVRGAGLRDRLSQLSCVPLLL